MRFGYRPNLAVRPDGREVYLVDATGNDGAVHVVDTATNAVAAVVPVGRGARSVAFSPDSRRAYVGISTTDPSGGVAVIDTAAHRVVATIPIRDGAFPVAVSPDGTKVYAGTTRTISRSYVLEIVAISTATNKVTATITLPDLPSVSRIVFSREAASP